MSFNVEHCEEADYAVGVNVCTVISVLYEVVGIPEIFLKYQVHPKQLRPTHKVDLNDLEQDSHHRGAN